MSHRIELLESRVSRLDDRGIAYEAFTDRPLDPASLRCLRAMHDVEFHTACYLRDMLVTPAHRDPEVTAFLVFWAYEEYWHGVAIGRVLAAHGETSGADRVESVRRSTRLASVLRPLGMEAASVLGETVIAVQMAWGAVNEHTTQAAYGRLATSSGHPVLGELLRRIMRQEGRHIAFYTAQAKCRLARSRTARAVTRAALRRLWSPVGSGILPASETAFLTQHLFGGSGHEQLARIDRRIDALPGLEGLALMARLARRYALDPRQRSAERSGDLPCV